MNDFAVAMKPLVATAENEAELEMRIRDARARLAFYASTPAYAATFNYHGLEQLTAEAKLLARAQRWEDLPQLIDDTVLNTYVTVGTWDQIGQKLLARYDGVVSSLEVSIPVRSGSDREQLINLVHTLHAA